MLALLFYRLPPILCLCWLTLWLIASPAHAAPASDTPNTPFAAWVDVTGQSNLETAAKQPDWEPFTGWKSWGYGPEPVWVRVGVSAASSESSAPQVLGVRPPYLDRVTFFDPATDTVRHSGDHLPAREDALGSVLFTFEVKALPQARHVFLRLETRSTRVLHLSLMPLPDAQSYTRWSEWATGGVLLLSLVFAVWALVQWRASRDWVTAMFALKQLVVTAWGFTVLGFARVTIGDAFEPGHLSLLSNVFAALMVASVAWFFAALLLEYRPRLWMLRVCSADAIVS
jgi:hypothetical protein